MGAGSSNPIHVVVAGGNFGGLELVKAFRKHKNVRVTMIEVRMIGARC
jgi:hypothetical protein